MERKNIIEGLLLLRKGINLLVDELVTEKNLDVSNVISNKHDGEPTKQERATVEHVKQEPTKVEPKVALDSVNTTYSEDDLNSMKFNDLKKLGASLGVKCSGTRAQIVERILALNTNEEEAHVVKEQKTTPIKKSPKQSKSKEVVEDDLEEVEEVVDIESVEEVHASEDAIQTASEVAEDMNDDEIIDYLNEIGVNVPSESDHNDILLALAKAIDDGLVEFEDEDVDDGDKNNEEGENTNDDDDISPNDYVSDYDVDGVNNPEEMSTKRAKACEKKCTQVIEDITSGKLSAEDVMEFVNTFTNDEQKEMLGDEPTDDELILMYLTLTRAFIDDDGDYNEPQSPYVVNDENYCCGHELNYIEDTNKFVCEICGTEYEAE